MLQWPSYPSRWSLSNWLGSSVEKKNELKHYGTGETPRNGFPLRKGVSHVSGSFGMGPDVIREGYVVINASQGSFK